MKIIWCMVSEIWSMTDRIFCHFGPYSTLLLPPPPPRTNKPKNQNFEKMKKMLGDIYTNVSFYISVSKIILHKCKKIILHKCIKNHDHMLHLSWDMVFKGCNYFSFWAIFSRLPPPPVTPSPPSQQPKRSKFFEKWKKTTWRSLFYICVPKILIRWCMVPEIWCMVDGQTDRFRWMDRWTDRQTKKSDI